MTNILILGGTTEARQLAAKLAARTDFTVTLSLAGRTERPVAQPVPVRVGGFGGVEGLAAYLAGEHIDLLVDATHPYAARISANAAEAAHVAGVPLLALRRPGWMSQAGDRWSMVDGVEGAIAAIEAKPRSVFVALGRNEVAAFAEAPQHHYLFRSVDPIEPRLPLPNATYVVDRGPFEEIAEAELLRAHAIDAIVCKNSGGAATYTKLVAARKLGIPVYMLRRPDLPDVPAAESVDAMVALIDQRFASSEKRGV